MTPVSNGALSVLALDPGERVGWARAGVAPDGEWYDVRHGITPLRDMAVAIHGTLCPDPDDPVIAYYDVVVMEDWRLYPHMAKTMVGSSFPSVQFVGMVRLCCWLNPAVKLVTQGAGIKSTADKTMAKLRPELFATVTNPRAHDDAHDMDALRHLWHWTFKTCVGSAPHSQQGVAA